MQVKIEDVLVEITVPGIPPSVNSLFGNPRGRGRRFKMPAYVVWEATVERAVYGCGKGLAELRALYGRPYTLEIELMRPTWLTKNQLSVKKPDCPNVIKAAEDAVCKVTGWADNFNIDTRVCKIEGSQDERTVIRFRFLDRWFASRQ